MESEGREAYPGIASFITFIAWNVGGWFGGYKAVGVIGFVASLLSDGFELLPRIGIQSLIIFIGFYYSYKYISKEIKRTRSAENRGILTDDDIFKISTEYFQYNKGHRGLEIRGGNTN